MMDADLITTPLYIIKKLQRDAFRKVVGLLTGRVLDIGCGAQSYRRFVSCGRYIGMDDQPAVKPGICACAFAVPLSSRSVDAVICTEVLEHLDDPSGCLSEAGRVLKTGGHLYLTVPQSWPLHYEPHDYWRFTKYGAESLVSRQGFEILYRDRLGGPVTLVGQQIVDIFWPVLKTLFACAGLGISEKIATALLIPASLFFYAAGILLDRYDNRYALGWAIVAVKR